MHIAVLGAGAMGSWFGGLLAMRNAASSSAIAAENIAADTKAPEYSSHGNRTSDSTASDKSVRLITTNQAHRDAITQQGLRIRSADKQHTIAVEAISPYQMTTKNSTKIDLILVLTKSFQTKEALSSIANVINDNTHVLSLQNGLGNAEAMSSLIPLDRIWVGVSMVPADKVAPGLVESKGHGSSYFGNAANENSQPMSKRILDTFTQADIELHHDVNIHARIWEKVAFNSGMNALCALSHGRPGAIGQSNGAKSLAQRTANEVALVASAQQVEVDLKKVFDMIDLSCTKHSDHIPSMLQDLLSQRRTEVDAINGAVAKIGEACGVPTPINDTLATLVRLAEISHQKYG